MNKCLFWIIRFILEISIVAVIPIAVICGVSLPNAGWFSAISFIILDIRDRFIKKYETI